jgi:hypothetical protein
MNISEHRRVSGSMSPVSRVTFPLALATLASLLGSADRLAAQQGPTLYGVVADESSWQPVASARVTLIETGVETETGLRGTFVFASPPLGRVSIRVEAPGFPAMVQEVEVTTDETLFVQFVLPDLAAVLDEILVVGRSRSATSEPRTAADLLTMEVRGALGNSGMVGVGGSTIMLRGVSSISLQGDPVVYLDGVRMSGGPGEAFLALAMIPASDVRDIRVSRGPTSSFLRGSADGVIEIWTKSGSNQR